MKYEESVYPSPHTHSDSQGYPLRHPMKQVLNVHLFHLLGAQTGTLFLIYTILCMYVHVFIEMFCTRKIFSPIFISSLICLESNNLNVYIVFHQVNLNKPIYE